MRTERWYERYAWVAFVVIGVMGLSFALPVMLDAGAGAAVFERLDGVTVPDAIQADADATAYVEFVYSFAFSATAGLDFLTVLVATFAFRHGLRWAWVAMLYWPVLFATNALTYDEPARYVQIGMLTLTAAALAATWRRTWRRRPEQAPGRPSGQATAP
jgi:hypothetical protein